MRIWPAIDVRNGKCVRLSQGDFESEKVYGNDPADMACRWESEGATGLHVVDLDRAILGKSNNLEAIARLANEVAVEIQAGGGIRDEATIEEILSLGVKRIVLGTRSITDFDWFSSMAAKYPETLVVTIDSIEGSIYTDGWRKNTNIAVLDHLTRVSALPLAGVIMTDISSCGMQSGLNLDSLKQLRAESQLPMIAAGGVANVDDIARLASVGMDGCVIGKALYEGNLTLTAAIAAATATHVH